MSSSFTHTLHTFLYHHHKPKNSKINKPAPLGQYYYGIVWSSSPSSPSHEAGAAGFLVIGRPDRGTLGTLLIFLKTFTRVPRPRGREIKCFFTLVMSAQNDYLFWIIYPSDQCNFLISPFLPLLPSRTRQMAVGLQQNLWIAVSINQLKNTYLTLNMIHILLIELSHYIPVLLWP